MKSTVPTRLQKWSSHEVNAWAFDPPKIDPNRGYPLINQTLVTVTGLFITITPGMTHKV